MRNLFLLLLLIPIAACGAEPTPQVLCGGDYHVQRNGVEVFCADCIDPRGDVVNYTGECAATPPPDIDPDAQTYSQVKYPSQVCTFLNNLDLSQFFNLFGRFTATAPLNATWPYSVNTIIAITKARDKHIGAAFTLPYNPGTIRHSIKGGIYTTCNGTLYSTVAPWTAKIVGIGTTPQPKGKCSAAGDRLTQAAILTLDPVCTLLPNGQCANDTVCHTSTLGGNYRFVMDTVDPHATAVWILSWQ